MFGLSTIGRFSASLAPSAAPADGLLPANTLTQHAAILGTATAAVWEDALATEQMRAGGGWIIFDLWPTHERRARLAQTLDAAGRHNDLDVLDPADPNSDRWNPLLSGSPDEVVAKLLRLWRTAGDVDREDFARALRRIVVALQAGGVRCTLSQMVSLWQQPKLLHSLLDQLAVGHERDALATWLAPLATGRGGLLLQRLSSGWVAQAEALLNRGGTRVFNTALPTLDLATLIAAGKCLYVPVQRHDPVSVAHARLISMELGQVLRRLPEQRTTPFAILLGDLGRVVPCDLDLPEQARRAGIGLVITLAAEDANVDGAGLVPTLLQHVGTRLLCVAADPETPDSRAVLVRTGQPTCLLEAPTVPPVTAVLPLPAHAAMLPTPGQTMLVLDAAEVVPNEPALFVPERRKVVNANYQPERRRSQRPALVS